jgi:hypothetical protein
MMMMDTKSSQVAALIQNWIAKQGLMKWRRPPRNVKSR